MCEKYGWKDPQDIWVATVEDKKEYCLLHAPAELKRKGIDIFDELVCARIQATRESEDLEPLCILSGAIFPEGCSSLKRLSFPPIIFKEAQFEGRLFLRECVFEGETSFCGCHFDAGCDFRKAEFRKTAHFGIANFHHSSVFESTVFGEVGFFKNAVFDDTAFFGSAIFNESAVFEGATFKGQAQFSNTVVFGHADFGETHFGQYAWFNSLVCLSKGSFKNSVFGKGACFLHAFWGQRSSFINVTFKQGTDFTLAAFPKGADFSRANFEDTVSFDSSCCGSLLCFRNTVFDQNVSWNEIKLFGEIRFDETVANRSIFFDKIETKAQSKISVSRCKVSLGTISFKDYKVLSLFDLTEQYDLANIHFRDCSWGGNGRRNLRTENTSLQPTRDVYQRMKAKYKAENNEYEASKWHIAEKEAQLKILAQKKNERFNWFALWLYKLVSGFGENPCRAFGVLLCLLVLPLFFGVMDIEANFLGLTFHSHHVANPMTLWLKFIPLTRSLEKSDVGWLRVLMLFWQLLVSLQAALFAFALRNNFRR